jgi:hypothetical protein
MSTQVGLPGLWKIFILLIHNILIKRTACNRHNMQPSLRNNPLDITILWFNLDISWSSLLSFRRVNPRSFLCNHVNMLLILWDQFINQWINLPFGAFTSLANGCLLRVFQSFHLISLRSYFRCNSQLTLIWYTALVAWLLGLYSRNIYNASASLRNSFIIFYACLSAPLLLLLNRE